VQWKGDVLQPTTPPAIDPLQRSAVRRLLESKDMQDFYKM
jgi:hypothetical protein